MEEPRRFLNWFTVTLWVMAVFMLMGTIFANMPIAQAQGKGSAVVVHALQAVQAFFGVLSCMLGLAAALRGFGSPIGGQLTAASCIVMAFVVPYGTVLFLVWLFAVRPRERPAPEPGNLPSHAYPEGD